MQRVRANTSRYISEFSRVIDGKIPPPSVNFDQDGMSPDELMMQQRRFNQQQTRQAAIQGGYANGGANNTLVKCALPPELER